MNQIQKFWKRLRSLKNVIAFAAIFFVMAGGVNPKLFGVTDIQFLVLAVGLLAADGLMERLVMLSDIEADVKSTSVMVNNIKNAVENVEMNVITDDTQISDIILKLTERVLVKQVQILSSGLTTRQVMIAKLLQKGIRVQALMQDPNTALDKRDKDRVRTALSWIEHHREFIKSGLFEARFHINISTVRGIIVSEASSDVKHIFLSWYYYVSGNSMVHGDANPTIYCTTLSKQGAKMYEWLSTVIEKDLRESRKITAKEFKQ